MSQTLRQLFAFAMAFQCVYASVDVSIKDRLAESVSEHQKTMQSAKDRLTDELRDLRKKAQASGELKEVLAIDAAIQVFEQKGTLPVGFARNPLSRFMKVQSKADTKQIAAYETAVRDYTKGGQLDTAKAIQKELDNFKSSPQHTVSNATVIVVSGITAIKKLAVGLRVFSNRPYVWKFVAPELPVKQFTQIRGGGEDPIELSVKTSGWVFLAVQVHEDPKKTIDYLRRLGWTDMQLLLRHNPPGRDTHRWTIVRKWFPEGPASIPRLYFSGPIVLLP